VKVIRPGHLDDLDELVDLFERNRERLTGISSLRANRDLLAKKLEASVSTFADEIDDPADQEYFFVLEDSANGALAGTCAIWPSIGLRTPFYSYKVGTVVHSSARLGNYRQMPTLYLTNDYTGTTEVGSLFLSAEYRGKALGKLLSLSRFLFMAEHRDRFDRRTIAEMRGYQSEDGTVPFWEGLGKHFFGMEFKDADEQSALGNKEFIAELMPKYPIYVPLLPEDARQAIGTVHKNTRPARQMLEEEGFRFQGYVDIFDAGPTLEVRTDDIRAVRESRIRPVEVVPNLPEREVPVMVANRSFQDFRAAISTVSRRQGEVMQVSPEIAEGLELHDTARVLRLYPTEDTGV